MGTFIIALKGLSSNVFSADMVNHSFGKAYKSGSAHFLKVTPYLCGT
ncbi:hypothetical protein HBO23_13575 [Pseudomonas sp. WS 5532]|uniref:Uncharacterized protein n=1 Tax=Pseudomonas edaphica TaxID=2006980 RepID=A0A7Y8FVU8_9PSED|nr:MULTISPECIES: hypothetical protein [Pseudomonas]MCF5237492.1 hypothetical protein [Pseudomonas sp. PA-5-4G]NMX73986.1 hypothetical protein [Pseudomonas sp. WS 5532]MCF5143652.1 hypothetical protein [Pseudomonas sp. PA-6-3C]MCF5150815.1 hypothetical protein [Pseudomonas sp. PA-6-3F]MCF5157350.1 hypothetical protein [Pseudomonas sp. PA-6-2E]